VKIDPNRPAVDTGGTEALKRATGDPLVQRSSAGRPSPSRDRVDVSSDAQLLASLLDAAERAPAIRPDAVERARRLLESGEIGRDGATLADRLIDHLLGR